MTLDLNRARVTHWLDLWGERRGMSVGPMFFGYYDSSSPLDVRQKDAERSTFPNVILDDRGCERHPAHIIVLIRKAGLTPRDGPTTGEVWFVGSDITDAPSAGENVSDEARDGNTLRRSTARDRRIDAAPTGRLAPRRDGFSTLRRWCRYFAAVSSQPTLLSIIVGRIGLVSRYGRRGRSSGTASCTWCWSTRRGYRRR